MFQLTAALTKTFRIKRRYPMSLALETLLPCLFVVGITFGWSFATDTIINGGNFIPSAVMRSSSSGQSLASTMCTRPPYRETTMLPRCRTENGEPINTCLDEEGFPGVCFRKNQTGSMWAPQYNNMPINMTSFDELVMMFVTQTVATKHGIGGRSYMGNDAVARAQRSTGRLIFTPSTPSTHDLIARLNRTSVTFGKILMGVMSAAEAERWAYSPAGEGQVWAIVHIDTFNFLNRQLAYTIRMNRSSSAPTNKIRERYVERFRQNGAKIYTSNGFPVLQTFLHSAVLSEDAASASPSSWDACPDALHGFGRSALPRCRSWVLAPMPFPAFSDNSFLERAGLFFPLVSVLSYLYPLSQLAKRIVEEKELRIREGMLIMGLSKSALYLSWIIPYVVMQGTTAGIITLLLKDTIFGKSSPLITFAVFFSFGLSVVTGGLLLSTLFSKSRMAALVSPFIFAVVSVPIFAIPNDVATEWLLALSVLSPSSFCIALRTMVSYEMATGMRLEDIASPADDITVMTNIGFLLAAAGGYYFISVYLDEVLPSEWGAKRHPLFFLAPSFWRELVVSVVTSSSPDVEMSSNDLVEASSSQQQKCSVQIINACKTFDGNRLAVDNLTTNLREGQITVLLGHNGAGKTTTINMLTGMLPMSSGDCVVYGRSVRTELPAIRRNMGLCPQHNILWPMLTCWEHLDFYAAIKGMTGGKREAAISNILRRVGLTPETHKSASELSGGQKRKLSVAIAFVGGSQFIILDEPTAGMDVDARHDTWAILREMTPGRTILLTTHFMDEADVLGHTVSIMTHGRLYCSGSPMFLKSKLGAGFTLSVGIAGTCDVEALAALANHEIPGSTLTSRTAGAISICLPTAALPKFANLFRVLERNGEALGVLSFGITNTTLEEVFTRIASIEAAEVVPLAALEPPPIYTKEDKEPLCVLPSDGPLPSRMLRHMSAIVAKRYHYVKRDRRAFVFQLFMPVVFVIGALLLGQIGPPEMPRIVISAEMYRQSSMLVRVANCSEEVIQSLPREYFVQAVEATGAYNMSVALLQSHNTHGNTERFVGMYCGDAPLGGGNVLFFNMTGVHSLPEAILSFQKGRADITCASHPLAWTQRESAAIQGWQTFITVFIILIPFTFVPATYASWMVKEKESKAKQLQLISGLHPVAYWLANFFWDFMCFLGTEFLVIIIFVCFQRTELIGSFESFLATFLIFTFFGLSGISFAYLASHFFESHSSAQNTVMLVNFVAGFVFVLTVQIMELLGYPTTGIKLLFRLVPAYCLGEGLIEVAMMPVRQGLGLVPISRSPLDHDVIGLPVVYMATECVVLLLLAILLDNPFVLWARSRITRGEAPPPLGIVAEDSDVRAERDRVVAARDDDLVCLHGLRKVFGNNVAVKNLSLGVHRGEIFGFLGTNGAGKTTTLSMLSGEFPPTHGHATLSGYDVVSQCSEARRNLGLCPQFDALLDLLTPREHLTLYCALRKIPATQITASVDALLAAAGLGEYSNSPVKGLSGGTKRKLSLAIALVGAPSVVFLDEPSAGMDPVARRSMWDTIRRTAVGRCVVLTTHHLEEVEALAHRVAIMVAGELRCIGTLPHLKAKYGSGYEMSVKVVEGFSVAEVTRLVVKSVEGAATGEVRGQHASYTLPQRTTVLSDVFDMMEGNKISLGVADYSISQTSLEQVFLRISHST